VNANNNGMIELHRTKRVQRGNPGEYSFYTCHSVLKVSRYKKFISTIPTLDCFALFPPRYARGHWLAMTSSAVSDTQCNFIVQIKRAMTKSAVTAVERI
jgi:hypothetical protein